ncbi:hypothetical protein ABIE12_000802 [Serratia sp. 509]
MVDLQRISSRSQASAAGPKGAEGGQKQKSLHLGGLGATFRFFSYAQSLLKSGAKVKKEAENNSVHVGAYLVDRLATSVKAPAKKVNICIGNKQ